MTANIPGERHLRGEGLEQYLAAGAPAVVKIEGTPVAYLVIEPSEQRLSLRTPLGRNSLPDVSAYEHISATVIHWNDVAWCELRVHGAEARDAYPVICATADRIQLDGLAFDSAVTRSLAAFRELLSRHDRLSLEEETGLFGELLVVRHLLVNMSPMNAILAWRGPDGEEHDFDLGGHDVEVKSTVAEERVHWIGDGNQLDPSLGRPLWLLSIQLTGANNDGLSLPELISHIRTRLPDDSTSEQFKQKLGAARWRDDAASAYVRKLRLRNAPAIFSVDLDFPALTNRRLDKAGVDLTYIVQFRYVLNLSGLHPSIDGPPVLKNLGTLQ